MKAVSFSSWLPGAVAVLALWGCGVPERPDAESDPEDVGGAPDGGSMADAAAEPDEPGEPGPPIMVTGHVNGGLFSMSRDPVSVCGHEPADLGCTETDLFGQYAIEAPANTEVALVITGDGLTPTLRVFVTGEEDLELGNTRMANEAGLRSIAEGMGVEHDPEAGAVFFGGVEFVSAALEPHSGERFFLDVSGRLLEDAVWIEPRGSGGFLNVEPGEVSLRFARPHYECSFHFNNSLSGWPDPDDPGIARVPILPGHHTSLISMYCGDP